MLHVADWTVDELRELLHDVVEEILEEKLGMLIDPDEGLELRPEVEASLQTYLEGDRRGDVFKALGLEW